jgi:hypothetical protein
MHSRNNTRAPPIQRFQTWQLVPHSNLLHFICPEVDKELSLLMRLTLFINKGSSLVSHVNCNYTSFIFHYNRQHLISWTIPCCFLCFHCGINDDHHSYFCSIFSLPINSQDESSSLPLLDRLAWLELNASSKLQSYMLGQGSCLHSFCWGPVGEPITWQHHKSNWRIAHFLNIIPSIWAQT